MLLSQLGIFGWKEADEPVAPVYNNSSWLLSSPASADARSFDAFAPASQSASVDLCEALAAFHRTHFC